MVHDEVVAFGDYRTVHFVDTEGERGGGVQYRLTRTVRYRLARTVESHWSFPVPLDGEHDVPGPPVAARRR